MKDFFSVKGKTALVTGAGRGLGSKMAEGLAAYGADVILWSRTKAELEQTARLVEANGQKAFCQRVDVSNVSEIKEAVMKASEVFKTIDILVNNAGMNIPQWAEDVTEEAWDKMMSVNLKGAFFTAQAVGKLMIKNGNGGKIINISSQAGSVGLIKRSTYCATKGGLNLWTKVLALEWAKHNINVNAVSPTFVETPMTKPMLSDKEFSEYVFDNILFDHLAKEEDVVGAVIYLASKASDMVTGHTLMVDGGWTAH